LLPGKFFSRPALGLDLYPLIGEARSLNRWVGRLRSGEERGKAQHTQDYGDVTRAHPNILALPGTV
jgi:hypothetical protein